MPGLRSYRQGMDPLRPPLLRQLRPAHWVAIDCAVTALLALTAVVAFRELADLRGIPHLAAAAIVAVAILPAAFRRRWPRGSAKDLAVSEIKVSEIGEDFEILWKEKLGEGTRLLADRSLEFLRWHYNVPCDGAKTSVLCCRKQGQLIGYLVIRDEAGNANGLRRSLIADMLVKQDDPETLKLLIVAAYKHAGRAGSHVLELQGFPANIRRLCAQWNPYSRSFPATPFYYKGAAPAMHKALSDGALWYGTPFDGDTTLMPEI